MRLPNFISVPILTGIMFGYHIGVIGPALPILKFHLNLSSWQCGHIVSVFIIGLILGALLTKPLLNRTSRKNALLFATTLIMIQAIIGYFSADFSWVLFYRLLSGIGSGLAATMGPLICVENAEAGARGKMTSLFQMFIVVGVALSYLLGYVFLDSCNTKFLFLIGAIPALIAWFNYIKFKNLKEPKHFTGYSFSQFKNSYLVALGVNFFQQASGINAITFFIQTLIKEEASSLDSYAYLLPLVFNAISLLSTFFLMKKVDLWGRKPFLLVGSLGMALCMAAISLNHASFIFEFIVLVLFIFFFGISFGPVTYLITNEVFPDSIRSSGASLSFFANCATNYIISLIFLPIRHLLGPSSMWAVFCFMSLLAFLFVWKKVPETAYLKTEDIVKKLN
jgi:MFS family permease